MNPFKLSGSTNWTVSSLGNQEESHFLWMNQAGIDAVGNLEAATLERSKPTSTTSTLKATVPRIN